MTISKITAKKAVQIGQWWVNGPVAIFMFAPVIWLLYPLWRDDVNSPIIILYFFLGLIIGMIPAWIYWSFTAPKWLVWAYKRVDNQGELRHRAEEGKLLWARGSTFGKTMIISKADSKFIEEVEANLNHYSAEPILEDQIEIKIGHTSFWSMVLIMLFLFVGTGIATIQNILAQDYSNTSIIIGIAFLVGTWGLFRKIPLFNFPAFIPLAKKYFSNEPQLLLNATGINLKAKHTGWIKWENVQKAHIGLDHKGIPEKFFFNYWLHSEPENKTLKEFKLDIDMWKLDHIQLQQFFSQYIPQRPLYEDNEEIYTISCYTSKEAEQADEEETDNNSMTYHLNFKIHQILNELGVLDRLADEDLLFLHKGDYNVLGANEDKIKVIEMWEEFLNLEDLDKETAEALLAIYQILRAGQAYDTNVHFV